MVEWTRKHVPSDTYAKYQNGGMSNHVESLHSGVSREGNNNVGRCNAFRQRLSVTVATLMRADGCSALKTVRARVRAAVKSTPAGLHYLRAADKLRKNASAKATTPEAKAARGQRKRKDKLDSGINYQAWKHVGSVAHKHDIPDTSKLRLQLYKLRGNVRVWTREL